MRTGGGLEEEEKDWRRIGGLEEDWRRTGGGLEEGSRRAGGRSEERLEEDWKRIGRGLAEGPILRPIERVDHCLGPETRINIYVDARFGPQKPAQGMIFTTPEAQDAHQHLC